MTVTEVFEQVKQLSLKERIELLNLLGDSMGASISIVQGKVDIEDNTRNQPYKLSDLRGLGKDIWENTDAQEYVNQLRDEWDERS